MHNRYWVDCRIDCLLAFPYRQSAGRVSYGAHSTCACHRSWVQVLEMEDVDDLCLDFTTSKEVYGQTTITELKEGGEDIEVDDDNKHEYIALLVGLGCARTLK